MTDKERIEELERENKKLKEIRARNDFVTLGTTIDGVYFKPEQIVVLNNIKAIREYQQNQKAVEALKKVREYIRDSETTPHYWDISRKISQLIKELGGKDE